ncbi:MAG TPA: SbcC/MukB-like Walker B domain-containing protein, partial [Longimicrobium sp.]
YRLCDRAEAVASDLMRLLDLARSDARVRVALQEARDDLATCEGALRSAHERLESERAIAAAARARLEENATESNEPAAEFARLTGRQRHLQRQLQTTKEAGTRFSERASQRRRELETKEKIIQEMESAYRNAALELEERVCRDSHSALMEVAQQVHANGATAAAATLLTGHQGTLADQKTSVRRAVDEAQARLADAVGAVRGPLGEFLPEFEAGAHRVRVRAPGALLTPAQLLARLQSHEEHQSRVLSDDERKLFEEFFLGRLAQRLRDRIDTAEALVRKVNHVLEKRPISGQGEIVQLRWTAIRQDPKHLEVPYYANLVEQLRANFNFFPEAGKAVVELFRSEVERLLEEDRSENAEEDFRSALRRAMDYREWFAFTLVVQQPSGKPTELTHRLFGQRSGAGRALVILLPLVAAVDVLLSDARPDAPKFVGLDEAFAGVDSDNIDRMFAVLVDLDFSWIMTNQDLWGVSPSVPGCTTYELILRGNVVAPVLFVWNGYRSVGMLGDTPASATDSGDDGDFSLASA